MRLILFMCLALGCAKTDDAPAKGPPKMKGAEMDRALELCEKYVERLCKCAETDATLKEKCELARSQPDGIKLHLRLLKGERGPLNDEERRISEGNVRDFQQACVEEDVALDPARCPRPPAE